MNSSGEHTLTAAFERQARLNPDNIAAGDHSSKITYRELNRKSDAFAAELLRSLGPRSEPVAVLLDQDIAFMIAILGIMKAGKSFCPVDPVYPPARIQYMIEDLAARAIVTSRAKAPRLPDGLDSPHRLFVENIDAWPAEPAPDSAPSAEDLAWIIYTSGSTGRPKGVTQNHANATRMTRDYTNATGITSSDRLTLLHPALTWDIFGALLSGAGIYPYDIRERGIAGIGDWLRGERITLYRSFPTTFRKVVDSLRSEILEHIRLVHLSGEIVTPRDVERFKSHFNSNCSLMVIFGSSEAGLVTAQTIRHDTSIDGAVPVGQEFDGVEVVLLDESRLPVEPGEVGEIAVRSPHVFPGYWLRDDLNQTAFLDPNAPGWQRTFLTGDLGRLDSGGTLIYAGRKDSQVKVRGHRIELAEVEIALQSIGEIKDAAAKAVDDPEGDKRLAAYIVFHVDRPLLPSEIRSRLEPLVPAFMIPSVFVPLTRIPSTPNGKLDRNALPNPGRGRPNLRVPYRPPRTLAERKLAGIWSTVLGIDDVGLDDAFLELGGDSLMAQQIVLRVRDAFQRNISASPLMGASTVAEMSRLL